MASSAGDTGSSQAAVADRKPAFAGFEPFEANFTQAPNSFFDRILGHYPLRVVTVIGILIRETIGWRDQTTGEKRVEVALPLPAFIRPELSINSARQGLEEAIAAGFVVRTAASTNRDSARYALRWANPDALKVAVERERRALGDKRKFAPVDPKTQASAKKIASDDSKFSFGPPESGGPKIGGQESGGPIPGGPKSGSPIVNKQDKTKDSVLYKHLNKTLNVSEGANIDKLLGDLDPRTALIVRSVNEVITLTGDKKSAARFVQMRDICEENGCGEAWTEALRSTEKAKKAGKLKSTPGAYFNGTLAKILEKRGVYVPLGTADERAATQAEIEASLAVFRHEVAADTAR